LDKETIAELPEEAQDLIRIARGERTSKFRIDQDMTAVSPIDLTAAAGELEALLERGDLVEAAFVHDRSFAHQHLDAGSPEADIALTFLWRAGRWTDATRLARQQPFWTRREGGTTSWRDRSPLIALAQLEIWAELRFATLVNAFKADADLAGLAADLRQRGIKGSLANGALGFALLVAGAHRAGSTWNLDDPIEGAATVWSDETGKHASARVTDALAMPASRFLSLVSPPTTTKGRQAAPRVPDQSTPAGAARLLASSTPYSTVAESLRSLDRGQILAHLSAVDFELAEAGGLPPSGAGGWSVTPAVSPEGSIDNIAALGLLAEWLGAGAFVVRNADLRQISRRAERWRRTTAGDWAYPLQASRESAWSQRPDVTTADRITLLLHSADPLAASHDQLRLWWAVERDRDVDVAERIGRRIPAAIRDATKAAARLEGMLDGAFGAAIALQQRNVPVAFVPALALLITLDRKNRR